MKPLPSNPERLPTIEPLVVDNEGLIALGIDMSNAWRLKLENEGRFPRRLSLGGRKTCYLLSEITEFIAHRAAERDASSEVRRDVIRRGRETIRKNAAERVPA